MSCTSSLLHLLTLRNTGQIENVGITSEQRYLLRNPNGADENKRDLLVYWEPLDKENHSRNLVITSNEPYMNDNFFEVCFANLIIF